MVSKVKEKDINIVSMDDFCSAVADDLNMLAALHDNEVEERLLNAMDISDFPMQLGLRMTTADAVVAQRIMKQALDNLPRPFDKKTIDTLAADYADIYLSYSFRASPYESVWLDEENLERQAPMFEVREWYERFGVAVPDWRIRADDHIVHQLQFLAFLFYQEEHQQKIEEVARFMDQHLLRWLGLFAERVAERCTSKYFAGAALLTNAYCEELREVLVNVFELPRQLPEEKHEVQETNQIQEAPLQYMPGLGPTI